MLRRALLLLCVLPVAAAAAGPLPPPAPALEQPVVWAEAGLSLLLPPGWTAETSAGADGLSLIAAGPEGDSAGQVRLLLTDLAAAPPDTAPLDALMAQAAITGYRYSPVTWLGDRAFEAVAQSARGTIVGRIGRLPDHRGLAALGPEPAFSQITGSLVFSAQPPPAPVYSLAWAVPLPPPAETLFDTQQTRITALAASDTQISAASPAMGVASFTLQGALVQVTPFADPTQPSGMAVREDGALLLGDTVCRCLQMLGADRRWAAPQDSFGGSAPAAVAGAGGTIFAIDRVESGFSLRWLRDGARGEHVLAFNAASPPLLAAAPDRVLVIEPVQSLIDGAVSASVSVAAPGDAPVLRFWLPLAPQTVRAAALHPAGWLALALEDGRVVRVLEDGAVEALSAGLPPATALAFTPAGDLALALDDGRLALLSPAAGPDRRGAAMLSADVPVQGRISAQFTAQEWTLAASAGDQVTLAATDLLRQNAVDMALRVFGPDGAELAYNDDQQGLELWNAFDSYLPQLTLPVDGVYRVRVEHVAGDGAYTLAYSLSRRFALEAQAVTLAGALSDVVPVQRWQFRGLRGQIVTFTMTTQRGDLDPTLRLRLADGRQVAFNDDGPDPALGTNAQLFRVTLPRDDDYLLEAGRFDFTGAGSYTIVAISG